VQRAPGIPCALYVEGDKCKKLGRIAPREGEAMSGNADGIAAHLLSSPAHAGDPVRRGFTAQALLSLEYWIARSSRATTSGMAE
jgi:hypothetical protein